MNGFEGPKSDEQIDIELFHEKAKHELEKNRIKEETFKVPYGIETVNRDQLIVQNDEARFRKNETTQERELKMIADVFEAIILEHGEMSEWFGQNAFTIKTSKYDDYENGVDAVIEFRGDEPKSASYLGLAVDVTFGQENTKKLNRVIEHIDKGRLGVVKYFHSEHMNIHGQLSKLPEVIIGVDKKTVLELAALWKVRKNKELSEHKIQIMMLLQIKKQLETYAKYSEKIGNLDFSKIFKDRLLVIEGILSEKKEIFDKTKFDLADDPVHRGIINYLDTFEKQRENVVKK